jgi:glycosyltransferase involved in cell wall biosynthesis
VEHGKQGFLVENDPDALARALNQLLSDPQKMKRFSSNALKKARTFDVNELGKQLIGVYEQAIQDKKEDKFVTVRTEETAPQATISSAQT